MSCETTTIQAYEGNDIQVNVDVSGISSLAGYTATFSVKENKCSTSYLFQNTPGIINGLIITFNITQTENELPKGNYWYEVTIDNGSRRYTLAQDVYQILESIVYVDATCE